VCVHVLCVKVNCVDCTKGVLEAERAFMPTTTFVFLNNSEFGNSVFQAFTDDIIRVDSNRQLENTETHVKMRVCVGT
jgi:hypothetical protein